MSILTSAISAVSAAFYSYTPRFPPSISYHLLSPSPSFTASNHYPSISCLYCIDSSLCTTCSNAFSREVFFKPPQVSSTDNDGGGNEEGGSSEDDVDEEEADDFFVSDIGLNDMAPPAGVSNRSTKSLLSEDSDTLPKRTTVEGLAQDANDSGDSTLKRTNTSVHSQEKLKFKESWRADFPFPVIGMALSEHIQYPTLSLEQEHSQQVLTVVTTKTVHCLHLKKI